MCVMLKSSCSTWVVSRSLAPFDFILVLLLYCLLMLTWRHEQKAFSFEYNRMGRGEITLIVLVHQLWACTYVRMGIMRCACVHARVGGARVCVCVHGSLQLYEQEALRTESSTFNSDVCVGVHLARIVGYEAIRPHFHTGRLAHVHKIVDIL